MAHEEGYNECTDSKITDARSSLASSRATASYLNTRFLPFTSERVIMKGGNHGKG